MDNYDQEPQTAYEYKKAIEELHSELRGADVKAIGLSRHSLGTLKRIYHSFKEAVERKKEADAIREKYGDAWFEISNNRRALSEEEEADRTKVLDLLAETDVGWNRQM